MAVSRRVPLRTFRPHWPERRNVDPEQVVFTYDRPSDTLFVDFTGVARPAVSVPADTGPGELDVYLRVEPVSEEVVGLQIEGAVASSARPAWLRDALGLADVVETGAEHARGIRSGTAIEKGAVLDELFDAVLPMVA